MAEYYHDIITEKSFKTLQELKKSFDFILIGGWAVFLYTKALKSKDIDIVLDYKELEKVKRGFDVSKNERLKKYEAKKGGVDIDIYLPHFSKLGFPVEDIRKYSQSVEGFQVPFPEVLLILKAFVLRERKGSSKGRKDLIDIFGLLKEKKVDWINYKKLVLDYNLQKIDEDLKKEIALADPIPELDLLNHKTARIKKDVLENLR